MMNDGKKEGPADREPAPAPRSFRILLLYYSFSGQTAGLLGRLAAGLKTTGQEVMMERLQPTAPLRFPLGGVAATVKMMITTTLRERVPIRELSSRCRQPHDVIILAGPTWSYNPSGPVLALLDRDCRLFRKQTVLPLISCRGYWRLHWWGLRHHLRKCGARVPNAMVFTHPHSEPWRTFGVFLKIAGRSPETSRWLGRHYRHYGHARAQGDEAYRFGVMIGHALLEDIPLASLDFRTPAAICRS